MRVVDPLRLSRGAVRVIGGVDPEASGGRGITEFAVDGLQVGGGSGGLGERTSK